MPSSSSSTLQHSLYGVSPIGEGGEYESLATYVPGLYSRGRLQLDETATVHAGADCAFLHVARCSVNSEGFDSEPSLAAGDAAGPAVGTAAAAAAAPPSTASADASSSATTGPAHSYGSSGAGGAPGSISGSAPRLRVSGFCGTALGTLLRRAVSLGAASSGPGELIALPGLMVSLQCSDIDAPDGLASALEGASLSKHAREVTDTAVVHSAVNAALRAASALLAARGADLRDCLHVRLWLRDMGSFADANAAYCKFFDDAAAASRSLAGADAVTAVVPSRSCVEVTFSSSAPCSAPASAEPGCRGLGSRPRYEPVLAVEGVACVRSARAHMLKELRGSRAAEASAAAAAGVECESVDSKSRAPVFSDALYTRLVADCGDLLDAEEADCGIAGEVVDPASDAAASGGGDAAPEAAYTATLALMPSSGLPERSLLHVQSLSPWAPLCIGPYSQANSLQLRRTRLFRAAAGGAGSSDAEAAAEADADSSEVPTDPTIHFLAGQIGLVPETMQLWPGSLPTLRDALDAAAAVVAADSEATGKRVVAAAAAPKPHPPLSAEQLYTGELQQALRNTLRLIESVAGCSFRLTPYAPRPGDDLDLFVPAGKPRSGSGSSTESDGSGRGFESEDEEAAAALPLAAAIIFVAASCAIAPETCPSEPGVLRERCREAATAATAAGIYVLATVVVPRLPRAAAVEIETLAMSGGVVAMEESRWTARSMGTCVSSDKSGSLVPSPASWGAECRALRWCEATALGSSAKVCGSKAAMKATSKCGIPRVILSTCSLSWEGDADRGRTPAKALNEALEGTNASLGFEAGSRRAICFVSASAASPETCSALAASLAALSWNTTVLVCYNTEAHATIVFQAIR